MKALIYRVTGDNFHVWLFAITTSHPDCVKRLIEILEGKDFKTAWINCEGTVDPTDIHQLPFEPKDFGGTYCIPPRSMV